MGPLINGINYQVENFQDGDIYRMDFFVILQSGMTRLQSDSYGYNSMKLTNLDIFWLLCCKDISMSLC